MSQTVSNRVLMLLAFGGVFVSGVLSAGAFFNKLIPCGESMGCAVVAAHPSSHLLGIPNAYIGLLAYLLFAIAAVYRELFGMAGKFSRLSVIVGYGAALIGFAVSVYLTYLEYAVINAVCKWCVASAVIMTLTLIFHAALFQHVESKTGPANDRLSFIFAPVLAILSIGGTIYMGHDIVRYHSKAIVLAPTVQATLFGDPKHILNPAGVVSVAEFGDLDCPVCHKLYKRMENLVKGSDGKIRFAFHNYPLIHNSDHKGALYGALISEIASDHGLFWKFLDTVYSQPMVDDAPLADNDQMIKFGQMAGLDPDEIKRRLIADRSDPIGDRVVADINLARTLGVDRTPSYIVTAPGVESQLVSGDDVFSLLDTEPYRKLIKGQ